MRQKYKKPRKVNTVSILLGLILLGVLYSLIQFGPPYWRKWKVKEALSEGANKVYSRRFIPDESAGRLLEEVREETMERLRDIGIEDPGLKVNVSKNSDEVAVEADYVERIKHPLIGKYTVLRFRPFNVLEIKRGGD